MPMYCLFCQSAHAKGIVAQLRQMGYTDSLSPSIVQRKWVKGQKMEALHAMMPGYVFLLSEEPIRDFMEIRTILGVIRCLGREQGQYELEGDNLSFAEAMYEKGGVISIQPAVREGRTIRLTDPVISSVVGKVLFVDWKKERAKIEYSFDQKVFTLWIGVDGIQRGPAEEAQPSPEEEAP